MPVLEEFALCFPSHAAQMEKQIRLHHGCGALDHPAGDRRRGVACPAGDARPRARLRDPWTSWAAAAWASSTRPGNSAPQSPGRPEDDPGRRFAGAQELLRFRLRGEAVARLQHPNIVQIYEVGDDTTASRTSRWSTSTAAAWPSIWTASRCRRARPPSLVETLARAVHAAHDHGIVHRDLKPANILLQVAEPTRSLGAATCSDLQAASPKITDFGLAKQLDEDGGRTADRAQSWARPATWPPNRPPGRHARGRPGRRRLRAGGDPLRAAHRPAAVPGPSAAGHADAGRATRSRCRRRRLQPRVPRDLETICLKCLEKEPAQRYASARDWPTTCDRFLDGEPIQARPVGPLRTDW